MFSFDEPVFTPVYFHCPDDHRIDNQLPAVIKEVLEIAPTAMIGHLYAKSLATYYRNYYYYMKEEKTEKPALPEIKQNHHFHLVIIEDPQYETPTPITDEGAVALIKKLNEFLKNTGKFYTDTHYRQIRDAEYKGYRLSITVGNHEFALFVRADQPYLINPKKNNIIFNNEATADQLFSSNDVKPAQETVPLDTQTPSEDDQTSDTSSDNESVYEDAKEALINEQTISINNNVTKEQTSIKKEIRKPTLKKTKDPFKKNKKQPNHNNIATEIKADVILPKEEQLKTGPSYSYSFWNFFYNSTKTKTRINFNQYKPKSPYINLVNTITKENKLHDTGFYTQLFSKSPLIIDDNADNWLADQINYISPEYKKKDDFRKWYTNDIIYKMYIIHESEKCDNAEIAAHITTKQLMEKSWYTFLPLLVACTYGAWDSEKRTFNLAPPLVGTILTVLSRIIVYRGKADLYTKEAMLLKECRNTINSLEDLNKISVLILNLMVIEELKQKNVAFTTIMDVTSKYEQNLNKIHTLISEKKCTKHDIINTILCLASIHGKDLLTLIERNKIPELNIPYLNLSEQERLFERAQSDFKALMPPEMNSSIKLSAYTKNQIIHTLDSMLLIYALRIKTEASSVFQTFEKEYPELIACIDNILKKSKWSDVTSIHQTPEKSKLFSCVLKQNQTVALSFLDKFSSNISGVVQCKTKIKA